MKKPKVGLYIKLLGAAALLLAADILIVLPSSALQIAGIIVLAALAAAIALISYLLARELRRAMNPKDTDLDDDDSYKRALRSRIGWGIFHLTWLSAGMFVLIWIKAVMQMPDASIAGAVIPFGVFAGIVGFAIAYTLVSVLMNASKLKSRPRPQKKAVTKE
ncbi:MAG: hypothetical protein A2Y33_00785 [Spirochaetes bacterium GWF1_51_8]|nr:MAG: hypothetical protein A2Y33_00785 [Spirochaetes bacterium GWF1_51_8]